MKLKNVHKTVLFYQGLNVPVGGEFEADENNSLVKHWLKQGNVVEEVKKSKKKTKKKEPVSEKVSEPEEVLTDDVMAEPKEEKFKESDK